MPERREQGDPTWLERGTMIRSATLAVDYRRLSLMHAMIQTLSKPLEIELH
jgi:hypothetical protein